MSSVMACIKVYGHGVVTCSSLLILGLLQASCLISCARAPSEVNPDQLRIVSLSPALTRTLEDLGLADSVVGCTPFCKPANRHAVIVGDLRETDYEIMVRLQPTHVLVQQTAAGLRPELTELARNRGWTIANWPADDLDDIRTLLVELPDVLETRGYDRAQQLLADLDEIGGPHEWDGRTLIVSGGQPLLAFGPSTYLGQLLARYGVPNALETGSWQAMSPEDVVRLNPDGIIVVGSSQGRAIDIVRTLAIAAVAQGRVCALDHPEALVPSSRVIEVAGALEQLLQQIASANMQMSAVDE